MSNNNSKTRELLGCLPKALFWNFILGAVVLGIGKMLGGPEIYIEKSYAIGTFFILIAAYLALTCWSIISLAKQPGLALVINGPYAYVRHPMYGAIIFILNPALGIFFRSWLLLLAIIPAYFIWKNAVAEEEKFLEEKFGHNYFVYKIRMPAFFPKLWEINKYVFYILSAVVVFIVSFSILNLPSVYLRWVDFESNQQIVYDEKPFAPIPSIAPTNSNNPILPTSSLPISNKANYTDQPNSIKISKLKIDVPLVFVAGTSQDQLNAALNQGVIFYPGSALPGQNGEVFLSGHSSTYIWNKTPYGQVFALLDKMEVGDTVSLTYEHYQYDYRITGKEILTPAQTTLTKTDRPTLTLMTCWPIGTSLKRLVVRGELVQ